MEQASFDVNKNQSLYHSNVAKYENTFHPKILVHILV